MRYLLIPVLCVALFGCKVDLALQEEIATLTKAVAASAQQMVDTEGRIAKVYADWKAGVLTKEQMEGEYAKLKMDWEFIKAQRDISEKALANASAKAKEQNMNGWDIALNVALSVLGVATGRRLGVPGLASKAAKPS